VSTPGKIIFAVVLAYIGLAASSLIGGFIAGVLGAAFQIGPTIIRGMVWWFPKIIFAGLLCFAYVVWDRRRRAKNSTKATESRKD
jgi:membrane protein implicated in regulation of membrane protease activity